MRRILILLIGVGVVALGAFWVLTTPQRVAADALSPRAPDLANGREVFYAGGCAACHATPGSDDRDRLGGGPELKSPFGTFYAPNISSDPADGIGAWSEADFVSALTKGTSPEGSHYYPAFPYTSYRLIALSDARDLFAYLRTLPPVKGKVRDHALPFPFNIRRLVGGWKLLFLNNESFAADASKSAEWNRGAYLVNVLGHCAECHSPRNLLGAIKAGKRFSGGANLQGEGWVPNITQYALADYSQDDFVNLLETGHTLTDSVGGEMRAVIRNTSELTPADRAAMAVYLKSLPPIEGEKH